jgi:hypothetical protein
MTHRSKDQIIYGLFDSPSAFERAFQNLINAGIAIEDISLLMNEETHDRDFKLLERTKTKEGIAAGGLIGGALGGILGGVASLGAAITGVGLIVVGPMIAFAAAGSLMGGLIGHGVPREEAERLHQELHAGKMMIAVHARGPADIEFAQAILRAAHAEPISPTATLHA